MTATATVVMTTRDETAEATGNRYRRTGIIDTAGHVVRVRIERPYHDSHDCNDECDERETRRHGRFTS